jgi:hypothetical protein
VRHEQLTQELVSAVASELERRAADPLGAAGLGERKDLEPAAVTGLAPTYGSRVEKDRKVSVPGWANTGRADLVVWAEPVTKRVSWLAELKWCGRGYDILYEGLWDLFKMALATQRVEEPKAYLLAGAEPSLWQTSRFSDLYENQEHDCAGLCYRELPDRRRTLAWDDLLRGRFDRYPDAIPARVRTTVCGRASVAEWELRAVEVTVIGDERVTMEDGWPNGHRPVQARHPLSRRQRLSKGTGSATADAWAGLCGQCGHHRRASRGAWRGAPSPSRSH